MHLPAKTASLQQRSRASGEYFSAYRRMPKQLRNARNRKAVLNEQDTGENRSELAGKAVMPCIVRNLTDDEATIIMVDSNLQREKVLPSEKAFAYKMKLDAMKRQGKRSDLTSVPLAQKLQGKTSRQLLGEQVGESQDQIRRYIRLTELITPILDMVDEGKIAMRPAVELSYLPKEQQQVLLDTMEQEDCTPSHAQAIKMRKFARWES